MYNMVNLRYHAPKNKFLAFNYPSSLFLGQLRTCSVFWLNPHSSSYF